LGTGAGFPTFMDSELIIIVGFIPMLFGMFYCFYGISLVTKNYINPSIDIIKSRNRFSSNTMNATLLAMTNSAAESFIIMNSIFFNVSDIGVYTVVGETAFYALLVQGAFYLVADKGTKIDWWIITREAIFLIVYVSFFSGFLIGNQITAWKAAILLLCYFVHIIMMILNQYYEVAIKKAVARHYELKEKSEVCKKDIHYYHQNFESESSRKITCDMLLNVKLVIKDKYIIHEDAQFRERANPKILAIFLESDIGAGIIHFRRLASRIILLIQAYNLNKKVQRSKKCKVDLSKLIKFYEEEYCMSESESVNPEELESVDVASEKASMLSKARKLQATESGNIGLIGKVKEEDESKNEAEKEFDEFEDDISSHDAEDKTIYDRINERVNKKVSIAWPSTFVEKFQYILFAPLSMAQFFTIPNVMVPGRENFYPLTLFMSIVWIYAYTFIIVWWTYELSLAWGINRSIIPLVLYPIGISIRDRKKLTDFYQVKKMFAEELPDQEISLAETFSGPIFQLTGLVGFTWLVKILLGGSISFENANIQYQAPLLLFCVVMKYLSVIIGKFKTNRNLFYFNLSMYG
jgi:Ca2+/Na+ antiporter